MRSKCQAELVCRTFRELLSNPTPGGFVWDVLDLADDVFQAIPLPELNRQALSLFMSLQALKAFMCEECVKDLISSL